MNRLFSLTLTLTAFSLTISPSFAQPAQNQGWYMHPAWGWGHMAGGGIMMILVWGAIIFLLFVLVRALNATHQGFQAPTHRTALEILKERFAKGEIDKEEFEERRNLLER